MTTAGAASTPTRCDCSTASGIRRSSSAPRCSGTCSPARAVPHLTAVLRDLEAAGHRRDPQRQGRPRARLLQRYRLRVLARRPAGSAELARRRRSLRRPRGTPRFPGDSRDRLRPRRRAHADGRTCPGTVPAATPRPRRWCAQWSPVRPRRRRARRALLRTSGAATVLDVAERRLDRKLRGAARIGARVAVIIGENEVASESAVVRDLDGHSQQTVPIAELARDRRPNPRRNREHRAHVLRDAARSRAGRRATAFGWVDRRRDQGGLVFIDLRDHTGILQVVIDANEAPEAHRAAREARLEWVLRFDGEIRLRAPENVNAKRETGRGRVARSCVHGARDREDTAVPRQRGLRRRRAVAPSPSIPRSATGAPAAQPARAGEILHRAAPGDGRRSGSWRSRRR